ncbi:ABC transporter permease [Bifidobacterium tsurumiense]|uniref:Peptide ABC transporter substrate-binding protein n=1 Tax=Bifidobacterium tsurumiense TaxID=356829 RepID=A0A087EKS6_9BIFI|nr:ABC transporter permease [Bifidobacterium tsurumiense]KFJ08377.1 peptide ABC transporter substrate-binding protein [Bifidobacterium tsurumiense]MDY4677364.1 ABC transporter permease [Bifidobacterium tsurumiense]MSS12166.1 ABC transporter permease [Bifidobacterium tsurumiense]
MSVVARLWQALRNTVRTLWSTVSGRYAVTVIAVWVVVSLISLVWTPYSLWQMDGYNVWAMPSAAHWMGTDGTGADVASWLMAGSRTDLVIVLLTVALSAVIGMCLVALMTLGSTWSSNATVVAVDALISIPTVLLALVLAVPFGASIAVVVVACGIGYGLNLARVVRPQALLVANSGYVESALSNGASRWRVFAQHIVPNILPVASVQLSLSAGTAILAESGLTYLGIGVPSGIPSWGRSLSLSVRLASVHPLTALWPGLVVALVVLALNLCGDVLRERSGVHHAGVASRQAASEGGENDR